MSIFDRCRRSWAATTPVKYEWDLKNVTGTFARWKILLTEKLTNGTLVTPTPDQQQVPPTVFLRETTPLHPHPHPHKYYLITKISKWLMRSIYVLDELDFHRFELKPNFRWVYCIVIPSGLPAGIMAWICNHIHSFLWDIITHPCPTFLKLEHEWIISHNVMWIY